MDDLLHVSAGDYQADLFLNQLHELPMNNYRKVLKIMLRASDENQNELDHLGDWLRQKVDASKADWHAESQAFAWGWKLVKNKRSRKPEVRKILQENDRLKRNVRRAKAKHLAYTARLTAYEEMTNKKS
jgi:hypothetical protein